MSPVYQYPEMYKVLDVNVSAVHLGTASEVILHMVQEKQKGYVCVAPASTIVEARRDPVYREVVNKASLVTPDGMPVAWLGQRRAGKHVARTYGPDLMLKVCADGVHLGVRHFFYGATSEICDKLERSLREKSPGLIVCGKVAPSFMREAEVLPMEVAEAINQARPDIIWVGLGSPKQDFWMDKNRMLLKAPVLIGIGAAFDFHAGVKLQAPRWMRACALEWFFRLCCEPGRLWKRYIVGNFLFVFWLVQEKFHRSFYR